MKDAGAVQSIQANAEQNAAQAKGYAEGAVESLRGSVKDIMGSLTGNERMQAEGKATNLEGDTRKKFHS